MPKTVHIPDHVLFEDDFVIVLNKPHGLMVEPDRNGHINLQQEVKKYLKRSAPGASEIYAQHIHRLDRPVSGVIVFAKQRSVLKNLSEQFAERRVKKFYQALTTETFLSTEGTLENWHRKEKKKAALYNEEVQFAEKAKLDYVINIFSGGLFMWDIQLHTGKYHQIRAQLSFVGCPILGDTLYGSSHVFQPDAIALHACRLEFLHPVTNEELKVSAETTFGGRQ